MIIDTPAALEGPEIHDAIYDASNVLIPVMPSPIDIRFATKFIAELLLVAQLDRGGRKVGIVAHRTRSNTRSLEKLMRFLSSLRIPVVGALRDSQNFVAAADEGIGVYELPYYRAQKDIEQMSRIVSWLDQWNAPQSETIPKVSIPEVAIDQAHQHQFELKSAKMSGA